MSESGPDAPRGANGDGASDGSRRPERPPVRALDPATAMRLTDGRAPLPALYLSDRLLVRAAPGGGATRGLGDLRAALAKLELDFRVTPRPDGEARDLQGDSWGTSITLTPARAIDSVDAWRVLQQLRQSAEPVAELLSLEHVLRPADGYWGGVGGYWGGVGGYWGGVGGYWGGVGGSALEEYSVPGRGGRMPVALALPDPRLRARPVDRSPVVVVPDTAIAGHPWFKRDSGVLRMVLENGRLVPLLTGPGDPSATPSATPPITVPAPSEPVGLLQGHATFIAGLVRQGCPEATILSIPVMGDDGIVDESVMLDVLQALLDRHVHGQDNDDPSEVVDVLSLSLGYYAEDSSYTSGPVADLLDRFAEHGILVVAGVGNDGTSSPFVPAALAAAPPQRVTKKSVPPLASVGATNPDGTTVALFSNTLTVVSAVRSGVSVVSTLPLTNGMGQPSSQVSADGTVRCTVDPDDYTGGFGVWSGTSFATPVFAAELAAALIDEGGLTDVSAPAMRKRGIRALRTCIGRTRS
ncbi:S8 family serine peptidase [Terrabacter aerolatus]|uniref:Peptidase S8 n=1 Tax=Terrabacter aerolatus TaxID=422442 RepID=A0A512CW95_9MICO|nr:S8/S53 family peptidase [Terrabacter aerolatus]GEO28501.1 peptidase S8 [Terrabacter aerolatus]